MTKAIQTIVKEFYHACKMQITNHRYPLVDSNVALHQLYGYLTALSETGFCEEYEVTQVIEDAKKIFPQFCKKTNLLSEIDSEECKSFIAGAMKKIRDERNHPE